MAEVGKRTRVYLVGPYATGDVAVNVRNSMAVAEELMNLGYAPYCPYLTHFWHMAFPHKYREWRKLHDEWLSCANAVLRMPGESSVAHLQIRTADELGIPVFSSVDELFEVMPPAVQA